MLPEDANTHAGKYILYSFRIHVTYSKYSYVDYPRDRAQYLKAFVKEPHLQQQGLRRRGSSSGGSTNSHPREPDSHKYAVHDTFKGDGSITRYIFLSMNLQLPI
jgi:hypothetical protein